jgi:opacity protein-like surface antigen
MTIVHTAYKIPPIFQEIRERRALFPIFNRALSLIIFLLVAALTGNAAAADEPFTGPANWGGTGLMEIPTARVLKEGRYRVGAAQVDPYRYFYGAVSPLEGLELVGSFTTVLGVQVIGPQFGDYKDKAAGIKYQLYPEEKWTPALAVGIMDPHGTRKYPSQYIVASKQIYPFDFTIGFGNGRFGKRPLPSQGEGFRIEMITDNASWRSDGQIFAGVQFAATDELLLMAEYSPIRYEKQTGDPARKKYFTQAVPSKFNFGLRWRPLDWLEAGVSWQRGEQIGANLSVAFDLGVPLIPLYDHPYKEKPEHRLHPLEGRIAMGLEASGFSDIVVRKEGAELWIEAQNVKYYYSPRAIGVMLRIVAEIVPVEVKTLHLTLTKRGIPMVAIIAERGDIALFAEEKLTAGEFLSLTGGMKTDDAEPLPGNRFNREWWSYGFRPNLQTYLASREGYFKFRLGLLGFLEFKPWMGGSFIAGLQYYFLNNVPVENIGDSSRPVRSDVALYKNQDAALGMLMYDHVYKSDHEIYARISGGLLETQYGGMDWEIAKPFWGGRFMVGLSGSVVKKRDPDKIFGFKENDFKSTYVTGFLNTRLNIPELETTVDLKTGQFLAGDRGTRLTLSKFFNGVILSAWYSQTNTDIFTDPWSRGYHDKGISFTIPMRLFRGTDSKTFYYFGLSPWTRDVAQDIDHFNGLFDFIGRDTQLHLKKDAASRDSRKWGSGL